MRECPHCNGMLVKYGFLKKERTQRYKCKECLKYCSDADKRTFGTLRTKPEKVLMVVTLLSDGCGVRAAGRIAGCHRDTVLRILKLAGTRCHDLLKRKLVGIKPGRVEADEIWCPVLKKANKETDPETDFNPWGDFYTFIALDADRKLMFMPTIGKRTENSTKVFAKELAGQIEGRFQLTTDGFPGYKFAMPDAFEKRVDFVQFYKEKNMRKNLAKEEYVHVVRCGTPNLKTATTAHVERINLTLRTHNKRFGRKTICFSKKEEYLRYSVYLFTAAYNFIKIHKGLLAKNTTPAMQAGLTSFLWNAEDLLKISAE